MLDHKHRELTSGPLGGLLGRPGESLEGLLGLLGASWDIFGGVWGPPGGLLGAILRRQPPSGGEKAKIIDFLSVWGG